MYRFSLAYTRIAWVLTAGMMVLYVVAVLFPAYWSGIDHMSANEIYASAPAVPFYAMSGVISESWLSLLPVLIVVLAWYGLPTLLLGAVVAHCVAKKAFSRTAARTGLILGVVAGLLYLTAPAARALLTYLVD